jgi:hypothetical protein
VLGGPLVALDARDARPRAEPVAHGGGEQSDPAVEVEVGALRVEALGVDHGLHGGGERGGGLAVDLPEPAVVEAELAVSDDLGDGRAGLASDDQTRAAHARGDDVDVFLAGEGVAQRRHLGDLRGRERQVGHVHDPVRARGVLTGTPLGVEVEAEARAPPGAVTLVVSREGLDRHPAVGVGDPAHPGERVDHHAPLQLALVGELDVSELGAAGAVGRVDLEGGRAPHVWSAVLARLEDAHRVGPPERFLAVVGDARHDLLAGQGVGHEHHPPVESGHRDAPVCDARHVQFDLAAQHVSHASSLTGWAA